MKMMRRVASKALATSEMTQLKTLTMEVIRLTAVDQLFAFICSDYPNKNGQSSVRLAFVKWRLLFRTAPCLFRVFQPLYNSRPEGQAPTVFLNFNAEPPWDPDPRDNY
ncbi:hypothetical protein D917_07096 [Trichinella nativa]|uniref:Uncharacterized protein n=1 Tax=Trichinella nativa TaxID=6335 RepID=A0A1Y3EPX9_9BILA|nr:hypothetical protein D917_07096 [Trichinella nativa]